MTHAKRSLANPTLAYDRADDHGDYTADTERWQTAIGMSLSSGNLKLVARYKDTYD